MLKAKLISFINVALFVITFALRSYTDAVYEAKGITSGILINLKYVTLIFGICFCILQMCNNKDVTVKLFKKEVYNVSIVIMFFIFITLCMNFIHCTKGTGSLSMSIEDIIKMVLPITYAYCVINTFKFDDIYISMVFTLFFSIIGYIIEVGVDTFSIANILKINFSTSFSPFESHYAAGTAIAMCTFFMYYRKNKLFMIISFLFTLFTFKRVSVLFAIVLAVLPVFINIHKNIHKIYLEIAKIITIIITLLYFWLLLPQNNDIFSKIFGENQVSFTMGRSTYIETLLNSNFSSMGLASTTVFIGKNIEMDLIRILIETSIIGLLIFVNCYWNCAGKSKYTIIYMVFVFLNMLTSHSITNSFSWILTFVIIGCINYKDYNLVNISR